MALIARKTGWLFAMPAFGLLLGGLVAQARAANLDDEQALQIATGLILLAALVLNALTECGRRRAMQTI